MKKFQFSLRAVKAVRAFDELRAQQALGVATRACQVAEDELTAARHRVGELENQVGASRRQSFRPAEQASFLRAHTAATAVAAEGARRLESALLERERRRQACVEANRRLKIVSKLEERALSAHRREVIRAECIEIDEIAGFRAAQGRTT